MPVYRDPVSELLDRGARDLLSRVYAERAGTWVPTRLADPTPQHLAWGYSIGLGNLMGRDTPTTENGRNQTAHSRWGRAFVRALYYQHRWWADGRGGWREVKRTAPNPRPLQVEWGSRVRKLGVIPAGRAVRVRQPAGGRTALRVVQARPANARIYDNAGRTAGRWADPVKRDWA